MTIRRPSEIIGKQNRYEANEVGVTHPKNPSFVKLADNGDIYIMGNANCGIIFNAARQSWTIVGDAIKFITKEDQGLLWNELAFNARATKYSEPAFIVPRQPYSSIYDDIDQFVE